MSNSSAYVLHPQVSLLYDIYTLYLLCVSSFSTLLINLTPPPPHSGKIENADSDPDAMHGGWFNFVLTVGCQIQTYCNKQVWAKDCVLHLYKPQENDRLTSHLNYLAHLAADSSFKADVRT